MNNQNTLTLSSDVCFKTKAITTSISSQSSQEVIFPDSNLASRLRVALNINDGEPITQAKLDTLIQFVAENANIESIEGLGAATNLKQLALNKNKIKDITPLNGLNNLQELYLEGNYISDLSGLGDLLPSFILPLTIIKL